MLTNKPRNMTIFTLKSIVQKKFDLKVGTTSCTSPHLSVTRNTRASIILISMKFFFNISLYLVYLKGILPLYNNEFNESLRGWRTGLLKLHNLIIFFSLSYTQLKSDYLQMLGGCNISKVITIFTFTASILCPVIQGEQI